MNRRQALASLSAASVALALTPKRSLALESFSPVTCKEAKALGVTFRAQKAGGPNAIAASKRKKDRLDARVLADLLRCDLFPGCFMAPARMRELRQMMRYRSLAVREATRLKNKTSGLLMEAGAEFIVSPGLTEPLGLLDVGGSALPGLGLLLAPEGAALAGAGLAPGLVGLGEAEVERRRHRGDDRLHAREVGMAQVHRKQHVARDRVG